MHKAWYCLGAVPHWFSRSSAKFQGHTAKKYRFWPKIEIFRTVTPDGYEMMLKSWSSIEEVPYFFQGHPWNFKVAREKYRWFWAELSVSWLSLQFKFTGGFEMIYKAWSNIEEVPYCLSRSSIKFKVTQDRKSPILTQIKRFWTVTAIWIHQWVWNDAQSLM